MVKKLDELGLVRHVPYKGMKLTPSGRRVALEVLRHHRLLELYLAESLGVPWDRVHDEAEVLEHVLSEELEALIAAKLGNPTHDPHGDPIPSAELEIEEGGTECLAALEPGARGVFVRVSDSDPSMLRYLAELGITPGERFEIVDRQPFGGPLFARFDGQVHVLGGDLAAAMRVEVDTAARRLDAAGRAAVHGHVDPVDVGRALRAQERGDVGELLGRSEAADRDVGLRRVSQLLERLRRTCSRSDPSRCGREPRCSTKCRPSQAPARAS